MQISKWVPSRGTSTSGWILECLYQCLPLNRLPPHSSMRQCLSLCLLPALDLDVSAEIDDPVTLSTSLRSDNRRCLLAASSCFICCCCSWKSFIIVCVSVGTTTEPTFSSSTYFVVTGRFTSWHAKSNSSILRCLNYSGNGPKPCFLKNSWGFSLLNCPTSTNPPTSWAFLAKCCLRKSIKSATKPEPKPLF